MYPSNIVCVEQYILAVFVVAFIHRLDFRERAIVGAPRNSAGYVKRLNPEANPLFVLPPRFLKYFTAFLSIVHGRLL